LHHAALEQGGPCRIRVVLGAGGDVTLEAAPLPAPGAPAVLEPVTVPGGLGQHKWRDRRLIDALEAAVAPAVPVLVDLDGFVLETTRANVLAMVGDTVVTPPLDGRILPGVTRGRALAAASELGLTLHERPLVLRELLSAGAVVTSGALRGLEPVARIGRRALPAPDDRARTLIHQFTPLR
jgi:para-aminobenzoate synthetase/4-amino-4-deoxychorismate lyase